MHLNLGNSEIFDEVAPPDLLNELRSGVHFDHEKTILIAERAIRTKVLLPFPKYPSNFSTVIKQANNAFANISVPIEIGCSYMSNVTLFEDQIHTLKDTLRTVQNEHELAQSDLRKAKLEFTTSLQLPYGSNRQKKIYSTSRISGSIKLICSGIWRWKNVICLLWNSRNIWNMSTYFGQEPKENYKNSRK